jgi:hypothetical protein
MKSEGHVVIGVDGHMQGAILIFLIFLHKLIFLDVTKVTSLIIATESASFIFWTRRGGRDGGGGEFVHFLFRFR